MFDLLSQKFSSLFEKIKGTQRLSQQDVDEFLQTVQDALLEADVPYTVITAFIEEIKKETVGLQITAKMKPAEQLAKIVHDKIQTFLGSKYPPLQYAFPTIILIMGLQGSGKTTTVARLTHWLKTEQKKKRVMVASIDYYRPAAIDQLEILARKAGAEFYRSDKPDALTAARDIHSFFIKSRADLLILDTAGRLHIDTGMLGELSQVYKMIKPQISLLVLDAMTGQESLQVAQSFANVVNYQGAILTKMDSDTRGGAAFSFAYALKKPILFIGTGEKVDDFERFIPERMAGRILGMGDLQTLLEKAESKIQESEQDRMAKAMSKGQLTFQDFVDQLRMVERIGSLTSLMKYLPFGGAKVSQDDLARGEHEMKKIKAMVNSMTPKERSNRVAIDNSRKQRIARGSGVTTGDVENLLVRFEETKQFVKLMKKNGLFRFPHK